MKILIYMIRWSGGVGRVISEIKPLLEKKGHEVEVISREDDLKCFSTRKAFFKIRKIVRNKNYDILYTQDWSCAISLLFLPNHFCFFHGHSIGKEYLFQYIVGKFMGRKLITGDVLNSRIFGCYYIPNGVNVSKFKPLGKKRRYIGWINKMTEVVNIDQIKDLGKKLKIPVSIADKIPPEKMNDWYNSLKVFVSLPPEQAGCQLSYMEAMASGVPIIIGNKNGEGFKYPFIKSENFKDIILLVKNSKKINYRRWVMEKKLTWENHVNKLLKLMNQK